MSHGSLRSLAGFFRTKDFLWIWGQKLGEPIWWKKTHAVDGIWVNLFIFTQPPFPEVRTLWTDSIPKAYQNAFWGKSVCCVMFVAIYLYTHITHIIYPEWLTCPMYPQLQSLTPWRSSGHLKILCGLFQIVWYSCIRKLQGQFFSHSGCLFLTCRVILSPKSTNF